jgi:ribosomal protein L40E
MTRGYDSWKLKSDLDDAAEARGADITGDGRDDDPDEHAVCDRCGAELPDNDRRCAECVAAGTIARAKEKY